MPPKRKAKAQSASNKAGKSLDASPEEALALKNVLETSVSIEAVPGSQLARVLGVRGGCHVVREAVNDGHVAGDADVAAGGDQGSTDANVAGGSDRLPKPEREVVIALDGDNDTNVDANVENTPVAEAKEKADKKKPEQACKGMALNPACLCGLIPENDTKYRMAGLWSKGAKKTDDDDVPTKRSGKQNRAGLENLGNTCYINSVLQTLFSIVDFKQAVIEAWMHQEQTIADVEQASHPVHVLRALKDIFVKLEVGPERVVDPAPLIEALRLDSSVQQDGHEFMKLFLTLLEKVPELSAHSLFRGRSGYQTMCMSCCKLSQSSHRFDDFLELDIPIKGFKGLQESLGSLLCPEILDGDNQYFCAHCDGKRDATRQLMVKDLPQVLCLSLQRFVFDLKKMDRVKANDKFSFPLELPASMITHAGGDLYDLEGILLHKGSSARQGHYVAHVNSDGVWYRFDDGDVSILDKGPQGHPDHGGRAAGAASGQNPAGKKGKAKGKKRGRPKKKNVGEKADAGADAPQESDDDEEKWAQCENPSCSKWRVLPKGTVVNPEEPWYCKMNPDTKHNSCDAPEADWDREEYEQQQREAGLVTSSNAYLLVYKRRGAGAGSSDEATGRTATTVATKSMPPAVTAWLEMQKAMLDADFQKKVDGHRQIAEDRSREVDQRRKLVRDILGASRTLGDGGGDGDNSITNANVYPDAGRFVMSSWLETWVNAEPKDAVPPVDNRALLCPHNALDPSKVQAAKRLSTGAWEQIVEMYGGAPALGLNDTCRECLLEQVDSILLQEDVEVNRDLYLAMCDDLDLDSARGSQGGVAAGATTGKTQSYFVGKQWLKNWRSRNGASMGSSSPTSSLVCEHGMLVPAHPDRPSTRVLIPADFWAYLQRSWAAKIAAEDRKDRLKQAEKKEKNKKENSKKLKASNIVDDGVEIIGDTLAKAETEPGAAGAAGAAGAHGAAGAAGAHGANKSEPQPGADRAHANRDLREFAHDATECPDCKEDLMSHLETHPKKEEEKSALRHLVSASQNLTMEPGMAYKMVPAEFLSEWRAYMGPSKAAKDPPELTPCMQAVACSTHGPLKIAFPSPALVNRRGRWMYVNGSDETFEIVEEADWQKLWAGYGTDDTPFGIEGITCSVMVTVEETEMQTKKGGDGDGDGDGDGGVAPENGAAGKTEAAAADVKALTNDKKSAAKTKANTKAKAKTKADAKADTNMATSPAATKTTIITFPEVCSECVMDREQAIRASLLNFESAEVMVEIVADEAAATGLKTADANQRQSKRARKNRAPIRVDSTTTLENAKLRMFEALSVHPKNIRAFLRGTELLDDSKPLLHYEVVPMDEIRIVDTGVHDVNDLTSIFPDAVDAKGGDEEGFTGTALHGGF